MVYHKFYKIFRNIAAVKQRIDPDHVMVCAITAEGPLPDPACSVLPSPSDAGTVPAAEILLIEEIEEPAQIMVFSHGTDSLFSGHRFF